jgi:PIG-X / PBN1
MSINDHLLVVVQTQGLPSCGINCEGCQAIGPLLFRSAIRLSFFCGILSKAENVRQGQSLQQIESTPAMRRRSTYITDPTRPFDPADVLVTNHRVSLPGLQAAREERLTFGADELPHELQAALAHELHIRWSPEYSYDTVAPFLSRLSPGLHVFYTPLEGHSDDLICPLLRKTFSAAVKCHSPSRTFIKPPVLSERFAAASAWQYHSLLPSLNDLVAYVQRDICSRSDLSCAHTASLMNIADSVDIDYDSISHTLNLNVYWSKPPAVFYDPIGEWTTYDAWNIDVDQTARRNRAEVGILTQSAATDAHDIQLSGFLAVVGEDEKPKATLFHFPSRHHILPQQQLRQQQYSVSIAQPQGLHPTLQITFSNTSDLAMPNNRPENSHCALQTYITLPSPVFVDEYAFKSNDPLFAQSHNIQTTHAIAGEVDLEAPDYTLEKWGSIVLLELATPQENITLLRNRGWEVSVPLHLRYLPPSPTGASIAELPWPIVYWACTAEEGTKFPVNPFDRVNVGFDGLYGPRTMFYYLEPDTASSHNGRLVERLKVPVYASNKIDPTAVEVGTLVVILAGFLWVVAKLWPGLRKELATVMGRQPAEGVSEKKKQI